MRNGFTTGSCAAAAATAAAEMLLSQKTIDTIQIVTPEGPIYSPHILGQKISQQEAGCFVIKDAGDDPDVTNGMEIHANVFLIKDEKAEIIIDGGQGIGRVTKPGLNQPVGAAAINSTPREMIVKGVRKVMESHGCSHSLKIIISAPRGEEIAKKTFNEGLGIIGGISIIGTGGIVHPMSDDAIVATIELQLKQKRTLGEKKVIIAPGNYGLDFLKSNYEVQPDEVVKCSNFIRKTIVTASELGFEKILFCSHIGKAVKLAEGVENTHSKYGDGRMEIISKTFLEIAQDMENAEDVNQKILNCVSTTEAIRVMDEYSHALRIDVMNDIYKRVYENLTLWGRESKIFLVIYENEFGLLGGNDGDIDLFFY